MSIKSTHTFRPRFLAAVTGPSFSLPFTAAAFLPSPLALPTSCCFLVADAASLADFLPLARLGFTISSSEDSSCLTAFFPLAAGAAFSAGTAFLPEAVFFFGGSNSSSSCLRPRLVPVDFLAELPLAGLVSTSSWCCVSPGCSGVTARHSRCRITYFFVLLSRLLLPTSNATRPEHVVVGVL